MKLPSLLTIKQDSKAEKVSSLTVITEEEVLELQGKLSDGIKAITKTYQEKGNFVAAAAEAAGELYGYGHTQVLFKPTKAHDFLFHPTTAEAMLYFIGGNNVVPVSYEEDAGFAINGGEGWSKVKFTNHAIDLNGPVAIVMGSYDFTNASSGCVVMVEYTFCYKGYVRS